MPDVVFINRTVGAGKTTVADALSDHERSQGRPHAVIDLDQLRRLWPSTEADPFHHELELQNLAVVAANYRRFGAQHFILAGVIESADEVPRYKEALNTDSLLICRLVVDDKVADERLRRRHGSHSEALDCIWRESRFSPGFSIALSSTTWCSTRRVATPSRLRPKFGAQQAGARPRLA